MDKPSESTREERDVLAEKAQEDQRNGLANSNTTQPVRIDSAEKDDVVSEPKRSVPQ